MSDPWDQNAALPPFGLLAEFKTVDELVDAANKVKTEGYKQTDAYSHIRLKD
jgi:hypothetical protein